LCFAFYSSGYPRALHSFPTRRSSDLESLSVRSSCSLLLPTLHPRQGRFCILRCQMALCLTLHALLLSTPPHHHKIQGSRCDCFRRAGRQSFWIKWWQGLLQHHRRRQSVNRGSDRLPLLLHTTVREVLFPMMVFQD